MEITINIPKNTYSVPTEIRQDVVQAICEAFLRRCCWSTFHPFHNGRCRTATLQVVRHKGEGKYYGFHDVPFSSDEGIRIRGCEMNAAFKALRNAGWHIFRIYEYGEWMGYKVYDKPFLDGGKEVTEFTDFID